MDDWMSPRGRAGRFRVAGEGVAAATALVAVVTGVSRLTGFVREAVIAAVFGASSEVDAYLVAYQVPNVVIAFLSTALVTAAVPVVSARVRGDQAREGHRLFRTVSVAVIAGLGIASLLMALSAPALVRLLAPGFGPSGVALAAGLTRILLLATVLVAGMNLVSGLLQIHRRFFWPAFVGIPFNAAMVIAALVFGRPFGVEALAWGFVVGSALRVLVQLPPLYRTGFRWLGALRFGDPALAAIGGLLPVILLGHVVSNLNTVVDRMVGSGLGDGAIAALNYAYRIVGLPHGLLVLALLQVLYPALGATASDRGTFSELATRGAAAMVSLLAPIAAALFVLAGPVVQVIYGRGAFTGDDAALTAAALTAYAPGLVALGVRDVAMRGLFGVQDRWRPAVVAITGMVVNVTGDLTLGPRFGVAGLGAATTVSYAVSALLAVRMLARAHRGIAGRQLAAAFARNVLAMLPAALTMRLAVGPLRAGVPGFVALTASFLAGAGVHLVVLALLRAPELRELGRLVRRRRRSEG